MRHFQSAELSHTKDAPVIGRTDEGKKQFDLSGHLAPGEVLGCFKATIERGNHADIEDTHFSCNFFIRSSSCADDKRS